MPGCSRGPGEILDHLAGSWSLRAPLPIVEGMSTRPAQRLTRRPHVEWWVLAAWGSIVLVVLAGVVAAAGIAVG